MGEGPEPTREAFGRRLSDLLREEGDKPDRRDLSFTWPWMDKAGCNLSWGDEADPGTSPPGKPGVCDGEV